VLKVGETRGVLTTLTKWWLLLWSGGYASKGMPMIAK